MEATENDLIKKAITCMDKATASSSKSEEDGFEIFGRYVASELRGITNAQSQRWAKLQIQNILYSVQVEPSPYGSAHSTPNYRFSSPQYSGSEHLPFQSRTPSMSPTASFDWSNPSPSSDPQFH